MGVQCECVYSVTQTIIKLIVLHPPLNREFKKETFPVNHRTLFQQTPWMYYTRNKNRHTLDIIIHCVQTYYYSCITHLSQTVTQLYSTMCQHSLSHSTDRGSSQLPGLVQ